jgi:MFS family permease
VRWWLHAWPGLLATLTGVGLGRFAFTSLVPFLIGAGAATPGEAAYLGAANLAGYLVGAALAARTAAWLGITTALRLAFALTAIALAACIPSWGFAWYFPWRVLTGITGGLLMVLGPSFILTGTEPAERGRTGGVIYTGVGIGIAIASLTVSPVAAHSLGWAWATLAAAATVATLVSWPRWKERRGAPAAIGSPVRLQAPALLIALAFATDGAGFLPHGLFWVDFIARSLGLGASLGAFNWLLFGIGAAFGPTLAGAVGDRIGLGAALIMAYVVKALAVLIPVFASTPWLLAISSLAVGALSPGLAALSSAQLTQLVAPRDQIRAWGFATLVFASVQMVSGYAYSYAYARLGSYVPLFAMAAVALLLGAAAALASLLLSARGPRR